MGHVTREGTTVPLPITHAELGHLVGAQRSTVTLALKDLAGRGEVLRRSDGVFVLKGDPPVPHHHEHRRRRVVTAPDVARTAATGDLPDLAALQARVAALGVRFESARRHTSDELERARLIRERSMQLRDEARASRRTDLPGG
jgi:hypothetical protein